MDLDGADFRKYKISALQAVSFTLVASEREIDNPTICNKRCMFSPLMAHQVFGESELIFGYEGLSINLYYHHNSSNCLIDIKYDNEVTVIEVDDIPKLMNDWLPRNYFRNKEDFKQMIKNEKNDQMFGSVIHQFKRKTEVLFHEDEQVECTYKITQIDTEDELFQEYHERFETFIIWFIDAANFIDLKDKRWLIFYIYEEFIMPGSGKKIITPIGFTAIYKFFSYPNSNRARISQFFILPTHQGKGLGTIFYKTVYNRILEDMPEITDLTVEEPNELFQQMRDYCDSLHIYKDLKATGVNLALKNGKTLFSYFSKHKINKKQSLRITDILEYLNASQKGSSEKDDFEEKIFQRFKLQKMNESHVGKIARGSNKEKIETEEIDENVLRQESKAYLDQLTPVVEKLIKTLKTQ